MFHLTISKIYYYILKLFVFRWQHSKGEEVLVTEMKIVISTFAIINWVMIKKCESPSHCLEKSKFQHRKKSRWKLLLKIGGQSLLIFFVIWKTFKFFWRHFFFFISKSVYHFWNITFFYNTSRTPTIIFQYGFSDDSNSDYSKEEEVSSEGNESSGRYSSIQLDQLKQAHFQIHPVLIVLMQWVISSSEWRKNFSQNSCDGHLFNKFGKWLPLVLLNLLIFWMCFLLFWNTLEQIFLRTAMNLCWQMKHC